VSKIVFILKQWAIVKRRRDTGEELLCLSGKVYGNSRFGTGQVITTSYITTYRLESEHMVVITRNGSQYMLGRPKATELFAKQRLMRYLQRPRPQPLPGYDDTGRITDMSGASQRPVQVDEGATILDLS
jgi:hypothetical protein